MNGKIQGEILHAIEHALEGYSSILDQEKQASIGGHIFRVIREAIENNENTAYHKTNMDYAEKVAQLNRVTVQLENERTLTRQLISLNTRQSNDLTELRQQYWACIANIKEVNKVLNETLKIGVN